MSFPRTKVAVCWWLMVWFSIPAGGALQIQRQEIRFPVDTRAAPWWLPIFFVDLDNDGLQDLLALGADENRLWIYRQRAAGFAAVPDQTIELPPKAAWIAAGDVDPQPGLELVASTATGVVYYRQDRGVFEAQPRTLIKAGQVFSGANPPVILSLSNPKDQTNMAIPVITANQVVRYEHNAAFQWLPQTPSPLARRRTTWFSERGQWMLANNPSQHWRFGRVFQVNPRKTLDAQEKVEEERMKTLLQNMNPEGEHFPSGQDRLDLNGDGREDLVLWRLSGEFEPKTDVFVFWRKTDNQLPERPSQSLHCSGFPIPIGPKHLVSSVGDLNGDGRAELILVTLKETILSWSSLVDMAVSRGLDWVLTIRTFRPGGFSRSPDARIEMSSMLPLESGAQELFLIDGDINGDGRQDVMVKRSLTQWDVFLSVADTRWFASPPMLSLEIPSDGDISTQDLNGDGCSDVIVQEREPARLVILLSQSPSAKGRNR